MSNVAAAAPEVIGSGADQPAPEAQTPPAAAASEESVGVLGWLGFIILNMAAWGMISVSSAILWVIGFGLCIIYCGCLIGLAIFLDKRGAKYRQFTNLLWVLGLVFLFVSGMFIAVNLIPGGDGNINFGDNSGSPVTPNFGDVRGLVPSNASSTLKSWAADNTWGDGGNVMSVNGTLYLNGRSGSDQNRNVMLCYLPSQNLTVVSPELLNPRHFREFQSNLYFSAYSYSSSGTRESRTGVWSVSPSSDPTTAELIYAAGSIRGITDESGSLYIRASYSCNGKYSGCWKTVQTILRSNGTSSGTTDLRSDDPCTEYCTGDGAGAGGGGGFGPSRPSRGQLFGVIFIALLPMMGVAAWGLVKKQMPGTFFNLWYGSIGVVNVLYLIIDLDATNYFEFQKWFMTIYCSIGWVVLVGLSAKRQELSEWLEELKTWAVTLVGISFFLIIHVDLQIPFNQEAWRWVVYFLLTVLQILLSALTSRTLPLVAGALGLFILAWKIAVELVNVADLGNGEFKLLATLGIVALQGIGIIVGAIAYAGNRSKIEDFLRAMLRFDREEMAKLTAGEGV